jgi:hypothetical protein
MLHMLLLLLLLLQVTQSPTRLGTGWVCTTPFRGAAVQATTKWLTHVSGLLLLQFLGLFFGSCISMLAASLIAGPNAQ